MKRASEPTYPKIGADRPDATAATTPASVPSASQRLKRRRAAASPQPAQRDSAAANERPNHHPDPVASPLTTPLSHGLDLKGFIAAHDVGNEQWLRLRLQAEEIRRHRPTDEISGLESLESSRSTLLLPHQVSAAHFAVSNPLSKGVLFADEVGLGKTIEAAMVIKEFAYRGAQNILVIANRSLHQQWAAELKDRFDLDFQVLDGPQAKRLARRGVPPYSGLRIVNYHFLHGRIKDFEQTNWDLVVVDEAQHVKNPQSARHHSLKSLPRRFTCLLTATPIQNYLPELHAISTLIDDKALGTPFSFRDRYCDDDRGLQAKNVEELRKRVAGFAVRTLRSDVPEIKFTDRIPKLFDFDLQGDEFQLYEEVSKWLTQPNWAFGTGLSRALAASAYLKLLASSTFALRGALLKAEERLAAMKAGGVGQPSASRRLRHSIEEEIGWVRGFVELCGQITENAKAERLVAAMPELLGHGDKVLIFTQFKATQSYLHRKLVGEGYTVVGFNGDLPSHANPELDERERVKEDFRQRAQVMIATDSGGEGLNLQFCHIVVNYDLPWNPMKIEQRIGRCHRIGQEHDVVVANLVATTNAVELRLVQLLSEKINLFGSVLGESNEILGSLEGGVGFERAIAEIFQTCRTPEQVEAAFDLLQKQMEADIAERRAEGAALLSTFDRRLHSYFDVRDADARAALSARTASLRGFVLESINALGGDVSEELPGVYRFGTPPGLRDQVDADIYHGAFSKDKVGAPYVTKQHPLVAAALDHFQGTGALAAVIFSSADQEHSHGLEQYVGRRGWWVIAKVTYSGLETEDHMLHLGLVEDGQGFQPVGLMSEHLPQLKTGRGQWDDDLPLPGVEQVVAALEDEIESRRQRILDRVETYYLDRHKVLDTYYGRAGDGEVLAEARSRVEQIERKVEDIGHRIDETPEPSQRADLKRQQDRLLQEHNRLLQKQNEQRERHFKAKQREIATLDEQCKVRHSVELVAVAQWRVE